MVVVRCLFETTCLVETVQRESRDIITVPGHLCFGQAQLKVRAYLTQFPTNMKWPSFDGGGVCTGER